MNDTSYDPDLPNANAVMAAICCTSLQFAMNPSVDLAKLVAELAHKLAMPRYAESKLIVEVAKRLIRQWDTIVEEQQQERAADVLYDMPGSGVIH